MPMPVEYAYVILAIIYLLFAIKSGASMDGTVLYLGAAAAYAYLYYGHTHGGHVGGFSGARGW